MEIHSSPPLPLDTIVEEKEEHMVSPTGGHITRRKAHFLKPTLPERCLSPKPFIYDLKDLSENVLFKGWKRPTQKWKTWVHNMHDKYQALWEQVGICEAILSSRYHIKQHKELTKQLVEVEGKLIKGRKEAARGRCKFASPKDWMDYFMGTGHELEHEAFLSLWLSNFVFVTSTSIHYVGKHVFPIAIHLARGNRVTLATAVLSRIYKDLSWLKDRIFYSVVVQTNELVNVYAPFQLVLVWAWERFLGSRPMPNSISHGEPRITKWHRLKVNVSDIKLPINSTGKSFQWRPYAIAINGWSLPKFYHILIDSHTHLNEDIHSFARCLRVSELVGLESIEQYLPQRFGMDQDLPRCFARCNGNPDIAWRNYSRPIQDSVLYIPSRLFKVDITLQYSNWWKQSMLSHCDVIRPFPRRPKGEVDIESSVKDEKDGTLENISDPLPVGECQNVPTLKDRGEGSKTRDLLTLGLELEARICRLEKHFAKLKK
ncbi:hypothetical protein GOBAR_AA01609 [Gossypium barbadense]|uniref:Aminotransferase-like plant mobile domain-containing protein n=1 Tax=Gossypium barbadense TaxID=3634 RepID=A0A2P5YTU7_GOSBA|nr:hypothetical protein GOBAR_AA01609 [Gossypium barbadense]